MDIGCFWYLTPLRCLLFFSDGIILWLETKNYVGETLSQNVSTYNIHLPIKDQLDKIIILWNKK